jgi:hypothetical protein
MVSPLTHKVIQHRMYEILKFITENEAQRTFLFPSNVSLDGYLQLLCSTLNDSENVYWELMELIYIDLLNRQLLDPGLWLNHVLEVLKGKTSMSLPQLLSECTQMNHISVTMESMQPFLQMVLMILEEKKSQFKDHVFTFNILLNY